MKGVKVLPEIHAMVSYGKKKKKHAAIVKSLVPYEKIGILMTMTGIPRSHDHPDMVLTCGYLWIDDEIPNETSISTLWLWHSQG